MSQTAFLDRPLCFTDVETTGTDPFIHEIIEIGLVVADQRSLQVIGELDIKVEPVHIELASAEALAVNGYAPEDWIDAITLHEAMRFYAAKTAGGIFIAHNAKLDWSFIEMAFRLTDTENRMDYHVFCSMSMAWVKMRKLPGFAGVNLKHLARSLGVPEEPLPHRAINGARTAYEVFRKLDDLP